MDVLKKKPGGDFHEYFVINRNQVVSKKEMLGMIPRFLPNKNSLKTRECRSTLNGLGKAY